jgi:hypothetical protein
MQGREASGGALGYVLGCDERKGTLEQSPALRLEICLDPESVIALAASAECERRTAGRRGTGRCLGAGHGTTGDGR